MKKVFSICACVLLISCFLVSTVFAVDISSDSLSDQITLSKPDSDGSCTIAYSIAVDQESDWNLELTEDADDNVSSVFQRYDAYIEPGTTITAQVSCAEDTRVSLAFALYDLDQNKFDEIVKDNGLGGGGSLDLSYTVPDEVGIVQVFVSVLPTQNTFAYFGGFTIDAGLYVDNGTAAPVGPAGAEGTVTEEPDTEDIVTEPEDEGSGINPVAIAGVGAAIVAIIIAIIKTKAGKAVSAAAVEAANAADNTASTEAAEETRVVTDPATGAQTLYIKDASGQWVLSDGGSVLDTGSLSDWQEQRTEDRAWQDQSNEGLKKPTKFEDIDRQEALEEEKIHRETYHEKIAIRHGMDASDMDAVYEKVAHDQARAEVTAQEWSEIAEHADTAVKIAENLKTTADYSVSALGAVTGPAGTVIKDLYAAGTTVAGDVTEAVVAGKDGWDIAQAASGAVAKSAVSVIQNHATGVAGKAAADILGGAATGGTDALVKGENVGQGIAKGAASGTMSAMVDTGGEMVGALKDGSDLGSLGKDLVSSASDLTGDLVKNTASDAINESFDKTFKELNKTQK